MEASWRATWPIHLQRLLIAEDCHLDVVGVLARSNEPESYAGWTSRGPGRDTHARKVKGLGPDKEQSNGPPGLGVLHRANNPIM